MQDFQAAQSYIAALTGDANSVVDFRCIHDTNKEVPAHSYRGTLAQHWQTILNYQALGYGIFTNINAMDGSDKRELANVSYIRTQCADLDTLSAQQNYERAAASWPAPSFAVQSSPGKFHVYWTVTPYVGNDRSSLVQRKLRQLYDGDKSVVDASRVMRLPGTLHLKNPAAPHLVTIWGLPNCNVRMPVEWLETALMSVNVIEGFGERKELGDPSLAAPSLEAIKLALRLADPNSMDRAEWIGFSAAIKQAAWSHADADTIFNLWSEWCARYDGNDPGENFKQWNSIRQTEVGWSSVERRVPTIKPMLLFRGEQHSVPTVPAPQPPAPSIPPSGGVPVPPRDRRDDLPEMLTGQEQAIYFAGCVLVENLGEILTPNNRFMNATKFNAAFGGKKFIIDGEGKTSNEAWQAATRSTVYQVPKVDHIRFLPDQPTGVIMSDSLDRKGYNTYKPAVIARRQGDATPFLRHLEFILPIEGDRLQLLSFLAHNAKYPGYKIPWAPVIQSAEGVGKGVLKQVIQHVMGRPYVHFPNAQEMVESGSKFNAWMRNKLFILVDEIKVDERRDMIEVLKPMISEVEIEIQGKGQDQQNEDNPANWAFFTNWKDAIPVGKNGRRFSIYYSPIQSLDDLLARGMNDAYFDWLYSWLRSAGKEIVADYLLSYPIERGAVPMRAPATSSTAEALRQARGPLDTLVLDAIEDQLPGFRGGWISTVAVAARIKATGARTVTPRTIATVCEGLGYTMVGRSLRPYFQEDALNRSTLYNIDPRANIADYGRWQGYE